jgi:hypothetical protein
MGVIYNGKLEALAQGLSKGLDAQDAAKAAGYFRHTHQARQRARRADVLERVAEIERERMAAARDLTPVIEAAMKMAEKSAALNTGPGMVAARGFLVEVARLKVMLPTVPLARAPVLSDEAWAAKWAHLART